MRNISKFFATSQALCDVDADIAEGECLGIVGHNGAGKSTLMNIVSGIFPPSSGALPIDGALQGSEYSVFAANMLGIRTVFQELSLCLNLTVAENLRIFHPEFSGWGWQKRAEKAIISTLDAIFPGHGIKVTDNVENLTLGQRQTLEIVKAFVSSPNSKPLRLLILDEPTSALDYHTARQFLDYLNAAKGGETSFIYISHMLDEVLACADRILVMKDGRIAGETKGASVTRDDLIELMGGAKTANEFRRQVQSAETAAAAAGVLVAPRHKGGEMRITLNQGEVVGLAGLAGHGQTELLIDLFTRNSASGYKVAGKVSFIPGDRQRDGIFPLWSITKNLTLQAYSRLRRFRLISAAKEKLMAERWQRQIDIKAADMEDGILSLSGGNQQKVLFGRSLDSDASVILMDDPTRGVDVATKEIIYRFIFAESAKGRGFVWHTTEMDELKYCDRVYVFRSGKILAEMPGAEATEEAVLKASF